MIINYEKVLIKLNEIVSDFDMYCEMKLTVFDSSTCHIISLVDGCDNTEIELFQEDNIGKHHAIATEEDVLSYCLNSIFGYSDLLMKIYRKSNSEFC